MILMYHNIADEISYNTLSLAQLQEQLAYLLDRVELMSMDAYVERVLEGGTTEEMVSLTFDDGYVSFEELVLPELEKYQIPASLYIPAAHIATHNRWDRDNTDVQLPILDWEGIRRMANHPLVTIGAHSMTHRKIGLLPEEEVRYEITESKKLLEKGTGHPVDYFSFPFGQLVDMGAYALAVLEEAGYRAACSTLWGLTNHKGNRYQLNRISVDPTDSLETFRKKCEQKYHPSYWKRQAKQYLYQLGIKVHIQKSL
ncbi:MAG: polysaccharide deacetylase family protein [Bacteroidota bacterium]